MDRGEDEMWDRVLRVADMSYGELQMARLGNDQRDEMLWEAVVDFMAYYMSAAADGLLEQVRASRAQKG